MTKTATVNLDAWSHGQYLSKLFLCEGLEEVGQRFKEPLTVWLLAGWYGLAAYMLLARERLPIAAVRSFDLDAGCCEIAHAINAFFAGTGRFKALVADINHIDYASPAIYGSERPGLVINTACEHLAEREWFDSIPAGTTVAFQSTDLPNETHVALASSVEELCEQLPLSEYLLAKTLTVNEPHRSYRRFMTIGVK